MIYLGEQGVEAVHLLLFLHKGVILQTAQSTLRYMLAAGQLLSYAVSKEHARHCDAVSPGVLPA